MTSRCSEIATAFLGTFVERVIPVESPKVAEMTKLLENIFRSVNIALVNELAEVCRRMNIDIWEVIHAATTKPFGFMPFYPGIGVGGHCIPVDPFYLSWKAKEYDLYVNFIELAAPTNDSMPYYATSRIVDILVDRGGPLKGARLLILGISFKKRHWGHPQHSGPASGGAALGGGAPTSPTATLTSPRRALAGGS